MPYLLCIFVQKSHLNQTFKWWWLRDKYKVRCNASDWPQNTDTVLTDFIVQILHSYQMLLLFLAPFFTFPWHFWPRTRWKGRVFERGLRVKSVSLCLTVHYTDPSLLSHVIDLPAWLLSRAELERLKILLFPEEVEDVHKTTELTLKCLHIQFIHSN